MKMVVYQDQSKKVFLEKQLEDNPETITLPENHITELNLCKWDVCKCRLCATIEVDEEIAINIPLWRIKGRFYEGGKNQLKVQE